MPISNGNRKILDLKRWEFCTPAPSATAAGHFIVSSRHYRQQQLLVQSNTAAFLYNPAEDCWVQVPSPALAGTFGAGACGTAASFSTYASWLTQVERWFGIITHRVTRRDSFSRKKEPIARIEQFVAAYNKTKAPFNWTATADSILEKLQRFVRILRDVILGRLGTRLSSTARCTPGLGSASRRSACRSLSAIDQPSP